MGGKALKNTITRRYSKEEYSLLVNRMHKILRYSWRANGMIIDYYVTRAYTGKDSFGDMDVLINASSIHGNIIDFINKQFSPNEIFSNSSVYSFDWEEFQIDFIVLPNKHFDISKIYYSYNDLGNFIGRIASKIGYRYGHFGLERRFTKYDGTRITVSTDPREIFEFLGFSYDRYLRGFESLEDIFEYIITSKYYSYDIFQYDQLNSQNKTRNKKRVNYNLFLEYIEDYKNIIYDFKPKSYYRGLSLEYFGVDLDAEEKIVIERHERKKEVSIKFNGRHIIDEIAIEGKTLGTAIHNFKNSIEDYDTFILETNFDEIISKFKKVNNLL